MGKGKPSKQQNIDLQYNKVRSKILKRFRSLEKRGYNIELTIPKIPKTKTEASIRNLEKLTLDRLYKRSTYHGFASYGEEVSGVKGRQLERKQRVEKAKQTRKLKNFKGKTKRRETFDESFFNRNAISIWKTQVRSCINGKYANTLLQWMDKLIADNGEDNVGKMIYDGEAVGVLFSYDVAYDDKSFNQYTSELIKYLPDQGELYSEQMEEYKEELINWSDLAEQEEGFFNE